MPIDIDQRIIILVVAIAIAFAWWRGQSMQPPHADDPCNQINTCDTSIFKDEYKGDWFISSETVICLNKKPYTIYKLYDRGFSQWRIVINQTSCSLSNNEGSKEILQDARFYEDDYANAFRNVWNCFDIVVEAGAQLNCQDATKLTGFLSSNSEAISKSAEAASSISTMLARRHYIDKGVQNGVEVIAKMAEFGTSEEVLFYANVFTAASCGIGSESAVQALTIYAGVGANVMDRMKQGSFYDGGFGDLEELADGLVKFRRPCNTDELEGIVQSVHRAEQIGDNDYTTSRSKLEIYRNAAQGTIENMTKVKDNQAPGLIDYLFYQYSSFISYNSHAEDVNSYFERGLYVTAKNKAIAASEYYFNWRSSEDWQKFLLLLEFVIILAFYDRTKSKPQSIVIYPPPTNYRYGNR